MKQYGSAATILAVLACVLVLLPAAALGATAVLEVTSEPSGVSVEINGQNMGTTPVTGLQLPAGGVTLEGSKPGYQSELKTFDLLPGELRKVHLVLTPADPPAAGPPPAAAGAGKGALMIINVLGHVQVFVDGQLRGAGSIQITGLSAGEHELRAGPHTTKFQLRPGCLLKLKVHAGGIKPLNSCSPARPRPSVGKVVRNNMGMDLVLIPAGSFMMGSPLGEAGRWADEGPLHQVTITKPFYLQTTEVTQAQWKAVMGSYAGPFQGDDRRPVSNVSWDQAQEFIKRLSEREGKKYRLPTEAEWEYACRAGSQTRFSFGEGESQLGQYAWYAANSGGRSHPVAGLPPNRWGLYDMHGNVSEWCEDGKRRYRLSPVMDPWGVFNQVRVLRGGSWHDDARRLRCANRARYEPSRRYFYGGLRVARDI